MRGYSESDKPEGISQYHTQKLTDDIKEFIEHIGNNHINFASTP